MKKRTSSSGFSLMELLLVVAILGIVSAIAIPSFMGSRRYARQVGDARANAQSLRMAVERWAMIGQYPPAGTYTWKPDGTAPALDPPINFNIKNASKMNITLTVDASRQAYVITATDTVSKEVLCKMDQNGGNLP